MPNTRLMGRIAGSGMPSWPPPEQIPYIQVRHRAHLEVIAEEFTEATDRFFARNAHVPLVAGPEVVPPAGRLHLDACVFGDAACLAVGNQAPDVVATGIHLIDLALDLLQVLRAHDAVRGSLVK